MAMASVKLVAVDGQGEYFATTSTGGQFAFTAVAEGQYELTVNAEGKTWAAVDPIVFKDGAELASGMQLPSQGQ
jgi:hypothetical protein